MNEDIKNLTAKLSYMDPYYWVTRNGIMLNAGPLDMARHPYQIDIMSCRHRKQVVKKGAQIGFTTVFMLICLWGLIHQLYKQGVLYLFPGKEDIADFTKARFDPLIDLNVASIGRYVRDTDNVQVKRIGSGNLYLRGARLTQKIQGSKKMSTRLLSIDVDRIVYDERDMMSDEAVSLATERVSHSKLKEEIELGTPSIPEYGVDESYNNSDQRVWMIRCQKCNHDTCLEMEFPECLKERQDGTVYRACMKCGEEIYPHHGQWVAQYPALSDDLVGWWVSQLNSAYVDPGEILKAFNDPPRGNITEVYNSKLGMAHIASENKLTQEDVFAICTLDAMLTSHPGPCAMGVDVGNDLHVVVSYRPNSEFIKGCYFARVKDFSDVHDIGRRFNVKTAVVDLKPEIRKAREFADGEPYEVFLCDYQDHQRGAPAFDSRKGLVTINRTEICDATHDLVTVPGRYRIPRKSDEVKRYAQEMTNIAKVLETDEETGSTEYRYRKLGSKPDHYRHATNYMLLAAMRVGVYDPERSNDRVRDRWDENFEESRSKSWMAM